MFLNACYVPNSGCGVSSLHSTALTHPAQASSAGTGFLHEAFDKDDVTNYTRPWFAQTYCHCNCCYSVPLPRSTTATTTFCHCAIAACYYHCNCRLYTVVSCYHALECRCYCQIMMVERT